MNHPPNTCVKQRRLGESGAAALAALARHYGLPLGFRDLQSILGLENLKLDLFYLLFAARKLGFDAVPLEGAYDDLRQLTCPGIVSFRGGQPEDIEFRVLYEINPEWALTGNPRTGEVERLSQESFSQWWTGDVVQILPGQTGLAELRAQWLALHDPRARLRRALGWSPRSAPRLLFLPAVLTILMCVIVAARRAPFWQTGYMLAGLGLCLVLSLWVAVFSNTCPSCSRLAAAAGSLPLATVGAAAYALLLLAAWLPLPSVLGAGLFFAAGAHVFLISLLARSRLICGPCIGIAAGVWSVALLYAGAGAVAPAAAVATSLAGFAAAWMLIAYARKWLTLQLHEGVCRIARQVAAEGPPAPAGQVRLVVYRRANCPVCIFFESVILPAIEEEFGDLVAIQPRDAGRERIPTPLIVVSGSICLTMARLSTETGHAHLRRAIEAASNPVFAPLQDLGGTYLVEPPASGPEQDAG